jgi:hypothetical protein
MQAATSGGAMGSDLAREDVEAGGQQYVEEEQENESKHVVTRRRCTPYAGLIQ